MGHSTAKLPLGHGTVTFQEREHALNAIKYMNGGQIDGKIITVEEIKPASDSKTDNKDAEMKDTTKKTSEKSDSNKTERKKKERASRHSDVPPPPPRTRDRRSDRR